MVELLVTTRYVVSDGSVGSFASEDSCRLTVKGDSWVERVGKTPRDGSWSGSDEEVTGRLVEGRTTRLPFSHRTLREVCYFFLCTEERSCVSSRDSTGGRRQCFSNRRWHGDPHSLSVWGLVIVETISVFWKRIPCPCLLRPICPSPKRPWVTHRWSLSVEPNCSPGTLPTSNPVKRELGVFNTPLSRW